MILYLFCVKDLGLDEEKGFDDYNKKPLQESEDEQTEDQDSFDESQDALSEKEIEEVPQLDLRSAK